MPYIAEYFFDQTQGNSDLETSLSPLPKKVKSDMGQVRPHLLHRTGRPLFPSHLLATGYYQF
jgi:hypothetical protein